MRIGSLAILLMCGLVFGEIVPPERRIIWNPGIPGGIPNRTTVFANVKNAPYFAQGDGVTDDSTAIQNAITACPSNQVVYVPAGNYVLSNSLTVKSGVTLRGAGPTNTIFLGLGTNAYDNLYPIRIYPIPNGLGTVFTVCTGNSKDSTNIGLNDVTGISAGTYLLIDQMADGWLINTNGVQQVATYASRENGSRPQSQIVEVLSVTGTNVTFDPPLYWHYTNTPQAVIIISMTKYAGIEDLRVVNSATNHFLSNLYLAFNAYCWLKNVESVGARVKHVDTYYAYKLEIRNSIFREGYDGYGNNRAYGILLFQSTACLVEDNILLHGLIELDNEAGGGGSVWGYNYVDKPEYSDPNWSVPDAGTHANHPLMILYEGNVFSQFRLDMLMGSSSHYIVFRNYIRGTFPDQSKANANWPIDLCTNMYFVNIIGNVLGTPGFPDRYQVYNITRQTTWKPIYMLGYRSNGDLGPYSDTNVLFTLIRHGNYDYYSNSIYWDPSIADHILPASYYLTSKPVWFSNVVWPPIGPDIFGMTNMIPAQYRYLGLDYSQTRIQVLGKATFKGKATIR